MAYRRINYYRILSMNVSGYRKLRGWNQYELAEKLHISRTYLSIIEAPNMKVNISLEILIALSEQLDVPLPKLFAISYRQQATKLVFMPANIGGQKD